MHAVNLSVVPRTRKIWAGSVLKTPVVCTCITHNLLFLLGKKSPVYFVFTARVYLHCGRRLAEAPASELIGGALEGAVGVLEAVGMLCFVDPGHGWRQPQSAGSRGLAQIRLV